MKEYYIPRSKKCYNCRWFEYMNVLMSDKGRCTKDFRIDGKCERIKPR